MAFFLPKPQFVAGLAVDPSPYTGENEATKPDLMSRDFAVLRPSEVSSSAHLTESSDIGWSGRWVDSTDGSNSNLVTI